MQLDEFGAQARVVIVAGKGGVGKTTVSATLARTLARTGRRVLLVEVDGRNGLAALFGHPEALTYTPTQLWPGGDGAGEILGRTLTADDALVEYLEDHGLRRILRRLASSGALEVVATAVPGIKDILVLGKVKQLERAASSGSDVIVVDAPAAGHAVTFLSAARNLLDTAGTGPIRTQAADVIEMLSDPQRCQVMLVTLPEETPVNELVDTAWLVEEQADVTLTPVVVNGLWPQLDLPANPAAALRRSGLDAPTRRAVIAAAQFRQRRRQLQEEQVGRLAEALPLPQLHLPFLFSADIGPDELEQLADAFTLAVSALEPAGQR